MSQVSQLFKCRYCGYVTPDAKAIVEHESDCDTRFLQWYEARNERYEPDFDYDNGVEDDSPDFDEGSE